jgi:hypothetical protein
LISSRLWSIYWLTEGGTAAVGGGGTAVATAGAAGAGAGAGAGGLAVTRASSVCMAMADWRCCWNSLLSGASDTSLSKSATARA